MASESHPASFLAATLAGRNWPAESAAAGGVRCHAHGEGIVELVPLGAPAADLVLSAGVHGDETAPIEVLDALLADLVAGRLPLALRLLVIFGNPAAMRESKRYLDDDLNRFFHGRHQGRRDSREALRAQSIEAALAGFFAGDEGGKPKRPRFHYDLHTAIRGSHFERFGLLPFQAGRPYRRDMLAWLAAANLQALLINRAPAGTFAYHSAEAFGAASCTLELGKVQPFGENDLSRFSAVDLALRSLVGGRPLALPPALPRVFTVADELAKQSENFELLLPPDVENFTAFPRGTLLARDGDYRYVVRHAEERVVFPNPSVKPGLRAGLMVVETPADLLYEAD
jgi:succinylglutamate desuccinylase